MSDVVAVPAAAKPISSLRVILVSASAGVGAMVFLGLLIPTAINGGLSMRAADASIYERAAPAIEAIDVAAVQAQLRAADAVADRTRTATDPAVNRLQRLSGL